MMLRQQFRYVSAAVGCLVLLSACHHAPKHARYIPKDATAVIGVSTKTISDKVAWSAITGSSLMDDLQKSTGSAKGKEVMNDLKDAGIDYNSTLFTYLKSDKRYQGDMKVVAVLPLTDAGKLSAFIKKQMPQVTIKTVGDRSEADLNGKAYAGWTKDVLIVMNDVTREEQHKEVMPGIPDTAIVGGTTPAAPTEDNSFTYTEKVADPVATAVEMDNAFKLQEDASILKVDRFNKLEDANHDITVYVNYESLMDNMGAKNMGMMTMMSATMWKNAAFAASLDFDNGKMTGDMLYYPADSMKGVAKSMGADNVDKDMYSRLPTTGLNVVGGYHLSPDGIKMMLDKMGMSGMANMALMSSGMSMDEILGAFTGDIAFSVNNLSLTKQKVAIDPALAGEAGMDSYEETKTNVDYTVAIKINKQENLKKLLGLLTTAGAQVNGNVYTMPNAPFSLVVSDKYAVVSNTAANAQAFISGTNKGSMPDVASKEVPGHPIGLYADAQTLLNAIPVSGSDSAYVVEVRKLFSNMALNGGEFDGDASKYHMVINMVDQKENSLMQLLHFAQRMSALNSSNNAAAATNPPAATPALTKN